MSLDHSDEDTIYRLACECEGRFDHIKDIVNKQGPGTAVGQLCTEFQERFAIWTSHLGTFAGKSQCLDRQLRDLPDLQDLVIRLLDVLRCSLQQYAIASERRLGDSFHNVGDNPDEAQSTDCLSDPDWLKAIDDTLQRLNCLAVTIRQASRPTINQRVERFALGRNSESLSLLCASAIQYLYPSAHPSLQDHLVDSMKERYTRLLLLDSRKQNLEKRRDSPSNLSEARSKEQVHTFTANPDNSLRDPALNNRSQASNVPSQSDLSEVDTQYSQAPSNLSDELSPRTHKTVWNQVNRSGYPSPPLDRDDSGVFACEWCHELIDKRTLSRSGWNRHIDQDLKPYVCLSENCHSSHHVFPTRAEWVEHMECHGQQWHRKVHLTPSWICSICNFNSGTYSDSQALYVHLSDSHSSGFTAAELRAISRQSSTEQPRAWDDCLLCSFAAQDVEEVKAKLTLGKRRKEPLKQEAFKYARKNREMTSPGPHSLANEYSRTSSDSDDATHSQQRQKRDIDRSKTMTEHIASHLQALMLLTLRFADLENISEDLDNDIDSEYADFDSEESIIAKGDDMDRLMEIASESEEAIESENRETLGPTKNAMDPDEVTMGRNIAVPDSDYDFSVVPRQYDDLSIEDDAFLKKVIKSGAFQSWKREVNQKLFAAAEEGNKAVVRSMLEVGADKNARGRDGDTPLHSAARKGHEVVVRLLVEAGVDKEAKHHGETPLHLAARAGRNDVVRLLVEAGADKEAKNSGDETPLHLAAGKGNEDVERRLFITDTNEEVKHLGETPLSLAASKGRAAVVRLLVEAGADKEARNKGSQTPLHLAAGIGHGAVVRLLVEAGADKEAEDIDGHRPLHRAIKNHETPVARLLIEAGADIEAEDRDGHRPLHSAIQKHQASAAKLLIEAGADIEAENGDGQRPLHSAIQCWEENIAKLLVEAGADVEAKSKNGKTPLHIASETGHRTIVELLRDPPPVATSRDEAVTKEPKLKEKG